MKNFGFTLNKDRQIDMDKGDFSLSESLKKVEPSFNICISCGTCTATCSAGNFDEMNLRKIILLIKRGELSGIKENIAKCMLCGKCMMACPRGVNTRFLILKINSLLNNLKT